MQFGLKRQKNKNRRQKKDRDQGQKRGKYLVKSIKRIRSIISLKTTKIKIRLLKEKGVVARIIKSITSIVNIIRISIVIGIEVEANMVLVDIGKF